MIDADLLVSLNEEGGEENVSTGWHAIEFLLWGQDLNADGPGLQASGGLHVNVNADRRSTYLAVSSDLLLTHSSKWWMPGRRGANNYRSQFVSKDSDEAITALLPA